MRAYPDLAESRNEELEVEEWRFTELIRMGVPGHFAASAAIDKKIDIRDIEQMIRSGCPPQLAIEIRA